MIFLFFEFVGDLFGLGFPLKTTLMYVCHNRRQLEIMELLYMRPGYPILLEWGWTPYISNEGKKEEYFPYLIEFFKQESKINDIQLKILDRKKSSGGNYDGFIGYCKNFDIKSREDGGYDCSTEIIAMGEVLEGLKGKRVWVAPSIGPSVGWR